MRNLKKVLALVLALVMAMSLMVTAGATSLSDYKDSGSVTPKYATAVDVATQLGVLRGMTDGTYAPQEILNRAQLATMIYRITTGDVTDVRVGSFVGGASVFTDTRTDQWYSGYIGFSADAGYLKGMGDGTYAPYADLTGYQVLAALLRALGYNEEGHNFCGANWTVEVARVATESGLLENISGDVDLNKGITREVAAQLIYNALFIQTVNYTPAYGYRDDKNADDLATDIFGIVSDKDGKDVYGDWGRPVTEWQDEDGEALVSIAVEPLAVYTEAVKNCDIYDDTGLDEGDKLAVYTNSNTAAKDPYIIDDNKNDSGVANQGRLTEVYEDCIVNIDTYLYEVTKVVAAKTDSRGHVTPAYVEATRAGIADNLGTPKYETADFAKGDMVLVTILDGEIQTMELAKSATGELTGLKGNIRVTDNIQKVLAVNGEDVTINCTAVYACVMALDENYLFYYDTYGNIIGSEPAASQYVVIDSIWSETVKGETTVYADIVDFAANETEEVVVSNLMPFENKAMNQRLYYNVYEYVIEDGEYILKDADFRDFGAVTYKAGDTTLTPAPAPGSNNSRPRPVQLNDETVVLLQTAFSPDGEYTSYVGYKSLPDFMCSVMQVLDEDGDGYADLVYALGARTSNRTIFIADINPVRTDVVDDGNRTVVTMEAYELVNGKLVETTFATTGWWNPEFNSWFADQIDTVGLYEITESDDGYTWFVDEADPYENVYKTTDDGNRVMIGDKPGEYYVLDNAEIFKFEGTWETVEDVTYEDDWTKADLDDKSLIFIQEDEDGNVVAVYDMWIQLDVTGDTSYIDGPAPVIYAGKTVEDNLALSLPAHASYKVTTEKSSSFVRENDDSHDACSPANDKYCKDYTVIIDTANKVFYSDINVKVTLNGIAKHNHTGLNGLKDYISVGEVNGKMSVKLDVADFATYTVADLKADLKVTCGHANQTIVVKDNTGDVLSDLTSFIGKDDITVVVTAEDGTTQTYPVIISASAEE